ncbi:hypothetical protein [Primorskyibacter sp. S87]|uniref:hypothetical protein n=1 Tax=Primorskyibacter sp. S87 TaxID=3415126 RepID=UPI003C7B1B9B
MANEQENASNPLSKGRNTDLRIQSISGEGGDKTDYFLEGAFMALDNLKIKYELHYNDVSSVRNSGSGFEKAILKGIYFPSEGRLNETWAFRLAVGLDWIVEFDNFDNGIGVGADQLGPFAGVALSNSKTGLSLIPLIQHFASYSGQTDVSQTAARLIALQPFATDYWAKLDLKLPYDWNAGKWPATAELQIGYNINEGTALYGDLLVGIGSDRPFDTGFGLGLRFRY